MLTGARKQAIFKVFTAETLSSGRQYWWRPRGVSMAPTICDGDRVLVAPVDPAALRVGDVVKFRGPEGFRMHRLIRRSRTAAGLLQFEFQGDNAPSRDPPVGPSEIVGLAVAVERHGRIERLDTLLARWEGRLRTMKRWIRGQLWRSVPRRIIKYRDVRERTR